MWQRRYSLRFALVLAVVLPLLAALGAASYLVLRSFEREVEHRMQEDVELIARAVRLPLSRALERDRDPAIDRSLASVFRINRVYGAYVYDADGRRIAEIGQGGPSPERSRLSDLVVEGERTGEYGRIGSRRVYSYFVPLTGAGGRSIGLLQVTRRRRDIQEQIGRLRLQVGGFLLVVGVTMTGLVLFGHYRAVGAQLGRLARSMTRVRRGERGHRASSREGPREIATLASVLNTMLDSIGSAEREIERQQKAQRVLEDRLRHTEKLAAIGRLSAGVAHELGTPLSVIDGTAQRALRNRDLPSPPARALRTIRDEVRRLEHIIRQLLDFGRRRELRRREVRAEDVARSAAVAVQDKCDRFGTRLDLFGPRPSPRIPADATRLEQALTNLLRNAIQAAGSGTVRLRWNVTSAGAPVLEVEDDGPGIPNDVKPHLFEPFFTTKAVGEGTGLGLAVVHGVVEEHDARIEVGTSELGGARFRIVFAGAASGVSAETTTDSPDE